MSVQRYANAKGIPLCAIPIENQRSSVSLCGMSAIVRILVSAKRVEANSKEMPCLRTLAAAFAASYSNWNSCLCRAILSYYAIPVGRAVAPCYFVRPFFPA